MRYSGARSRWNLIGLCSVMMLLVGAPSGASASPAASTCGRDQYAQIASDSGITFKSTQECAQTRAHGGITVDWASTAYWIPPGTVGYRCSFTIVVTGLLPSTSYVRAVGTSDGWQGYDGGGSHASTDNRGILRLPWGYSTDLVGSTPRLWIWLDGGPYLLDITYSRSIPPPDPKQDPYSVCH